LILLYVIGLQYGDAPKILHLSTLKEGCISAIITAAAYLICVVKGPLALRSDYPPTYLLKAYSTGIYCVLTYIRIVPGFYGALDLLTNTFNGVLKSVDII
jgi:hypothetical protein